MDALLLAQNSDSGCVLVAGLVAHLLAQNSDSGRVLCALLLAGLVVGLVSQNSDSGWILCALLLTGLVVGIGGGDWWWRLVSQNSDSGWVLEIYSPIYGTNPAIWTLLPSTHPRPRSRCAHKLSYSRMMLLY